MNTQNDNIEGWLEALTDAVRELAQVTLGFETASILSVKEQLPENLSGSYIALVGETSAIQVGVISDAAGCDALARALLGMEMEEELSQPDMVDAVGEVANILGGTVKRRMIEQVPDIRLGLPIFLHGRLELMEQQELIVADVAMGELRVQLLVIKDGRRRRQIPDRASS